MNAIIPFMQRTLQNKHTSGAAAVYFATLTVSKLGAIWFPQHTAQFEQTAEVVKGLAVTYGLIMAGDAGANNQPPAQPPAQPGN
jgi:hypothetical protein